MWSRFWTIKLACDKKHQLRDAQNSHTVTGEGVAAYAVVVLGDRQHAPLVELPFRFMFAYMHCVEVTGVGVAA